MDGPPSLAQQVERLEHEIVAERGEQRALQRLLEDSVAAELHAMDALEANRAEQQRCRRLIEEKAQAISARQDRIAALIPDQRRG